jgi:biotin-dependent carboxylase-like uncharacterized protein
MTEFVVASCGPRTSLQDFGRAGLQRYGVSNSGAMDRLALATANALVGNPPGTASIELMLLGGTFSVEGASALVGLAGARCAIALDREPVAGGTSLQMEPGQVLSVSPMQAGVYAYLAVAGGFDLAPELGSLSLHQRAALGGFKGRPFAAGDRIPLAAPSAPRRACLSAPPVPLGEGHPVRVVLGPQDDHFTEAGLRTFLEETYRVSQEADRMGYRLSGPRIEHAGGFNIVSDGIVSGSVQVPGTGEPIVMMADRQTTGGYPKIATVISADLRLVAQRRPGDPVRFRAIGVEAAQQAARERAQEIAGLPDRLSPVRAGPPTAEELFALNLAGAAVDAFAPED